ncbi:MAG TPA: DUF998 domain-containing protein [Humibacter sp.]|jgi:hypothetical protein|nr:DUF998 domain-containing protein [Humibacter sp.]
MEPAAVVAGWVSLAGVATTIVSLVALHIVPTGLSPRRNAVSQYGISRFRGGYRVATIALGVAGGALAVASASRLSGNASAQVTFLLGVFAVARLIISWFPMDVPGGERTTHGRLHGLIAIVTFVVVAAAALRLGALLGRQTSWPGLAPISFALGGLMVACLIGMASARSSTAARSWFGAIERVFYVGMIAWITVFAVACLR